MKDLDTDKRLCDACLKAKLAPRINAAPGTETTYSTTRSGDKKCCGDDLKEGGYPYPTTGANKALGGTGAGTYQSPEAICNDYVGAPAVEANWIDNDCKNGANCRDSGCRGVLGPTGAYCCSSNSHCSNKLNFYQTAFSCEAPFCVCTAPASGPDSPLSKTADDLPLTTCIPLQRLRDYFAIIDLEDEGSLTISVSGVNPLDDGECKLGVVLDYKIFEDRPTNLVPPSRLENSIEDSQSTGSSGRYFGIDIINGADRTCLVTINKI
jgi:hypothetical protein